MECKQKDRREVSKLEAVAITVVVLGFLFVFSLIVAGMVYGYRDGKLIREQWEEEIRNRPRKPKLYMPMADERKDVTP